MRLQAGPLMAIITLAGALVPVAANAQSSRPDPLVRAEQLMRAGRVFAAESVYYWAATSKPRDPASRLALGRFLAARGALRTAATLMEEARFFGGDPAEVARHLAPVYQRLGEYRALAALPATPLSPGEQQRAAWLRDNRPTRRGPDSVVVSLRRMDTEPIGAIVLRIGGDSIIAQIDPTASGLTLDSSWTGRRAIRRFAPPDAREPERVAGVIAALAVGELALGNVPVSFAARGDAARAVIGMDFLAPFSPTFDERAGTLILRPSGRAPRTGGRRIPTLLTPGNLSIVEHRSILPLESSEARALLAGRRWTWRGGEIVVE